MNYQSTPALALPAAACRHARTRPAVALTLLAAALGLVLVPSVHAQDAAAPLNDEPLLDQADPQGNFPVPALVSPSWKLDFRHDAPSTLAVNIDGRVRWYWYLPVSITNQTPDPLYFVGRFTVLTDGGRIITTNRAIPDAVFDAIKAELANPLLLRLKQTAGPMLPGPDSQRDTVAIWPVPNEDVDRFSVFVNGIYGEVAPLPDPVTGQPLTQPITDPITGQPALDEQGNPRTEPILVQRTLRLDYLSPGTPRRPQQVPVTLTQKTDVMR